MNKNIFESHPPTTKFSKIPNGLYKHLKPIEIAVYVYIAGQVVDWDFSARRIANEMIGISRNTVDKALKGLEEKGFLKRVTLSNRKMRYRLSYIEAEYTKSIFDHCKGGTNERQSSAFAYYLSEHDSKFRDKHIHLTDKQISSDCELIQKALANGSLDNDAYNEVYKGYVSKFLNDENYNTDKHFPAFVYYLLGQLDDSYRGFNGDEALTKEERSEFL